MPDIPAFTFGMPAFPDYFYQDRIVILARSGVDENGAPDETPGDAGPEIPCSVQETTTSGQGTVYMGGVVPAGETKYMIRCKSYPGELVAGQAMKRVKNRAGALDPPVWMYATGPAEPMHGIGPPEWKISGTSVR